MPSATPSPFRPRCADFLDTLDDVMEIGALAGVPHPIRPTINTRLLTSNPESRLTVSMLRDVFSQSQRLAQFAGYDFVFEGNPDFADLRSVPAEVLRASELTVTSDSFQSGSFVIEAALPDEDFETTVDDNSRILSGWQVADHFYSLLNSLGNPNPRSNIPIGMLQALEELGRIVGQAVSRIEFRAFTKADDFENPRIVEVTPEYVDRVRIVRSRRRTSMDRRESLEGQLTALDLNTNSLKLRLIEVRNGRIEKLQRTVLGKFDDSIRSELISLLGAYVKLSGVVEYRTRSPKSIKADLVEPFGPN